MIEIIGIIATVIILASMCVKTTSHRGSFWMRVINIVGCLIFVIYGIFLPAVSTAILNSALVVVNAVHLILLVKDKKKTKK